MKRITIAIGFLVLLHASAAHAQSTARSRIGASDVIGTARVWQYSARVTVPTFPPVDGQNVSDWIGITFFSPATSSGQSYALLQPVLNFGANDTATGRGNYWSITPELNTGHYDASGNLTSDSSAFGLTYVVNPGEHIDMLVARIGAVGGTAQSTWRVQLRDEETGATTFHDYNIMVQPSFIERLDVQQEFVNATACVDTPSVLFDNLAAFDPFGSTFPLSLTGFTDSLPNISCRYGVSVNLPQVRINF